KKRRGDSSTQNAPTDVLVSQISPQPEPEGDSQQPPSHAVNQDQVTNDEPISTDFEGPPKRFRAKQPVRRRTSKKLPTASTAAPLIPTAAMEAPKSHVVGPSMETLAAAGPAAQRIWQFMPTPGLIKK
ncbi:hypothetical protein PIB30_007622, partial [Stylosanthes scabra]|nr:hypothetical protein [Stylosanthes scabra]